MDVVAWIATALLVVILLPAGLLKATQPLAALKEKGLDWVEDFSPGLVKTIGALEVLAVVGLVVPPLVDVASGLAVAAAVGVVLLMIGAAITHGRRREFPLIGLNAAIAVLAVLVIVGRTA